MIVNNDHAINIFYEKQQNENQIRTNLQRIKETSQRDII